MDNFNFDKIINFFQTKQKTALYVLGGIIAIAAGIYYLTKVYLPEQELEAQKAVYMAQLNFENKNFDKALNGDAKFKGFNYIKDNYSMTKVKDIAQLYAGLCELNLGKYDKAIESLKGFSSNVDEIQAVTYSALGDAYAEKNNMNEALSYYDKAAAASKNNVLAPRLTFKAAKAYEVSKNKEKALALLKQLKSDYPNSQEANMVDMLTNKISNQ